MPIKRVWIEEGCIACELSAMTCPEVFSIDRIRDTAEVIEGVDFSKYEEEIIDAADACPVEVIKYE